MVGFSCLIHDLPILQLYRAFLIPPSSQQFQFYANFRHTFSAVDKRLSRIVSRRRLGPWRVEYIAVNATITMTTAAQQLQRQPPQLRLPFDNADIYDPDEVVPRGSPLMKPLCPKLEPSPSPPPDIPAAKVGLGSTPINGHDKANRLKVRPTPGDAVLVAFLGDNRNPDIARKAGSEGLPDDDESPNDEGSPRKSNCDLDVDEPALHNLAKGALEAAFARGSKLGSIQDISIPTRQLSLLDDPPVSSYGFPPAVQLKLSTSPRLVSIGGELPPLQKDSSRTEPKEQLPSLRSTLGDIDRIALADKEHATLPRPPPAFPGSSPANSFSRFPHLPTNLPSSPVSPNENFSRTLSPHSTTSSNFYYTPNSHQRAGTEYSGSVAGETPNTDLSGSTPANSASTVDRMSIDEITNPQANLGTYVCKFDGCKAAPFQTQYLLNSHANVHSSARPHYCSVKGCPRSEGGKGFKRKNEMIRHGLVHDSPGYVCPFCPDREHKYPRPDNLQRYVTIGDDSSPCMPLSISGSQAWICKYRECINETVLPTGM